MHEYIQLQTDHYNKAATSKEIQSWANHVHQGNNSRNVNWL